MNTLTTFGNLHLDDLTAMVARKVMAGKAMIQPFVDFTDHLTELLHLLCRPSTKLIGAGTISPEVAQAADRADVQLVEQLGYSPFTGDLQSVLSAVSSPSDIIYVANPNRITGANFSLTDLEAMAQAVPNGWLIIDEYYFDYFGVTGLPLLDIFTNVLILRAFTACFSINSSDAGFVIANTAAIDMIKQSCHGRNFSATVRKTILAVLANGEVAANRLREVHDDSLRIATALNRLGVRCRICVTDFLLMQVADPKSVGNQLARAKVPIENLDGYPQMRKYVKYQIQSHLSNNRLIAAFERMPPEYFRTQTVDRRAVTLRHGKGNREQPQTDSGAKRHLDGSTVRRDLEDWPDTGGKTIPRKHAIRKE